MIGFVPRQELPLALSYDDVLLVPKYSEISSRSNVDLSTHISNKVKLKIPLISANMDSVTGVAMAIALGKLGGLGVLPRFCKPQEQADKVKEVKDKNVLVAASVGIKGSFLERSQMLVNAGVDVLNVDTAHGHLKMAVDATKVLKNKFPNITLISGIVATGEAAQAHYNAGADCVAVGVGGGSICTTRIQTGFGLPTFDSLRRISPVAKKFNKTFIPVAGLKNSGDIVKSLALGCSAVWCGSLFAGTDEAPGELIKYKDIMYKKYNGSTSESEKINQVKKDNSGKNKMYIKHIEGVEALTVYKGPLKEHVTKLLAGVRSGLSYCGANNIQELQEMAEFVQVTNATFIENNPHDVVLKT